MAELVCFTAFKLIDNPTYPYQNSILIQVLLSTFVTILTNTECIIAEFRIQLRYFVELCCVLLRFYALYLDYCDFFFPRRE